MDIHQLEEPSENEWDKYVKLAPNGTFFHLTGWKKVLEATFGYKPLYLYACQENVIKGILPLFFIHNVLFGKSLISVPFAVYGGIVGENSQVEELLLDQAKELAGRLKVRHLELRNERSNGLPLPVKELYVTFQREIHSDMDKNLAAIPRKQRRMIRQASNHGLTFEESSECLNAFYHIYAHSLRNLGTPVFPLRFFQSMQQEFGQHCKIFSVWYEGKMVAGVLTFFYNQTILPYYGGALRPYLSLAVNDFMYWELMRYGAEHGYTVFDFGRSRIGTGSYHFKRHWGFEPKSLPYQYYLPSPGNLPNASPSNPKFKLLISVWKNLPLPITKTLGPRLIRYLP